VGTVEVCRAVGITREIEYRWRAERVGLAPLELAETARSNRYHSALERRRIATLRDQELKVREIARGVGRAASTASCSGGLQSATQDHESSVLDDSAARSS
jgi:hypothetical protein